VAYVTFAPFVSGAERSLQAILLYVRQVGVEPIVLCPPRTALIPWCEEHGIRYVTVVLADRDKWHPIRWFKSVVQVARVLRHERIDIVHSNQVWCFAAAGTAAGWLRIPRVVHVRDELSVAATRWWCRSGVEAVVCISQFIRHGVDPAWRDRRAIKVRTIPNPVVITSTDAVHTKFVELNPHDALTFRRNQGVAEGATVFGFVGQVVPVKGVAELLRALADLPPRGKWHLLIAGRDPREGQPYERLCRELSTSLKLDDRVTFVGFLEDLASFYDAIDCAVVPSLEEPLGRIPFEAAAHAKPSIAFATGGLKETIIDGKTGWLVPTGDVEALRNQLALFIDLPLDDRVSAGLAAQRRAQTLCDPMTHVTELATLYNELRSPRT
jgi:glycosyltransferase involved in cell wall biosynthesis